MYTKYTYSCYRMYLIYCIRFTKSVSCMRFHIEHCINGENCVSLTMFIQKFMKCKNVVKFYMYISPIFSCESQLLIRIKNDTYIKIQLNTVQFKVTTHQYFPQPKALFVLYGVYVIKTILKKKCFYHK